MSSSEVSGGDPSGLVVVADPADPVAVEVRDFVRDSGREATILDVFDAAQLFTVIVHGPTAVVEPALPMFLRLPAPPLQRISFDAEFQLNECLAHLWAVAALTPAPVINRPEPGGLGTRVSASAALTELRAGLFAGSPEVFSSRPCGPPGAPADGQGSEWWVQDLDSWTTRPWSELPDASVPAADGSGPYRARWSDPEPLFESVVVLGDQAWRSSPVDLDELGLEQRSTEFAARLGLQLAAVVWRLSPDLAQARPVVVEPFPDVEQLRMVWLGLGPQLVKVLFP
ncbi:hypothetical protein [Streptomyces sp. NPDC001435]|uniref:hypothetical protein n=1 Tax=unclassified Streptomyces TaxID=2593676 RepID=UPI0036B24162